MDDWVESQARRLGYTDVSHSIEVRGLCPACAGASRSRATSGPNRSGSLSVQSDRDTEKGER